MSVFASPRGVLGYVGGAIAGVLSAFILAFSLANAGSVLVVLAYLATVPLFVAGFGAGAASGVIAAIVGVISLMAISPSSYGIYYVLANALPAALLIYLVTLSRVRADGKVEWCSEGKILTAVSIYPALAFLLLFAATGDTNGGMLEMTRGAMGALEEQFTRMLTESGQQVTPDAVAKIHLTLDFLARVTPGLAMCAWMISTIISMTLAQIILARRGWNLRPSFALSGLQVPNWVVYAVAVTGLVATFAPAPFDYVGLNLSIALGTPFFFVGLAIVHALVRRTRLPLFLLIVFYAVMSLVIYLALIVAVVGAVDQWVDFRKRFAAGPQNGGDKS